MILGADVREGDFCGYDEQDEIVPIEPRAYRAAEKLPLTKINVPLTVEGAIRWLNSDGTLLARVWREDKGHVTVICHCPRCKAERAAPHRGLRAGDPDPFWRADRIALARLNADRARDEEER